MRYYTISAPQLELLLDKIGVQGPQGFTSTLATLLFELKDDFEEELGKFFDDSLNIVDVSDCEIYEALDKIVSDTEREPEIHLSEAELECILSECETQCRLGNVVTYADLVKTPPTMEEDDSLSARIETIEELLLSLEHIAKTVNAKIIAR